MSNSAIPSLGALNCIRISRPWFRFVIAGRLSEKQRDDLNVDAVFAKLKTIGGKKADQE
jgi:hypothetical protein